MISVSASRSCCGIASSCNVRRSAAHYARQPAALSSRATAAMLLSWRRNLSDSGRVMLFASVLARLIRIGRLTVIDAAGRRHVFEGTPGPAATVRLRDPALHWKLALNPRLYVPQAYMEGQLTVEEGTLYDFLDIL